MMQPEDRIERRYTVDHMAVRPATDDVPVVVRRSFHLSSENFEYRLLLDSINRILREVCAGVRIILKALSLRQTSGADSGNRKRTPIVRLRIRRIVPELYVEEIEIVERIRDDSSLARPI